MSNPAAPITNWQILKSIGRGGQGKASIVMRAGDHISTYFMKELSEDKNSTERRARMHREVACYRTLGHSGIPKLIDSNADQFADTSVPLYLVTDLINGQTFSEYVNRNGPRPPDEAIDTTCRLLTILEHVHQHDMVHRDVKPDNVMLRNNIPQDPVLVDFGMSFLALEDNDLSTSTGQEIGNRFLRLPEFHIGSQEKQNPRSDLTHCVAILFYLLTGIRPSVLTDHSGQRPHQRQNARTALQRLSGVDTLALLDVFDRGFETAIHARWDSAGQLREALQQIRLGPNVVPDDLRTEDISARIKALMDSHDEKMTAHISDTLNRVGELMKAAQRMALRELGPNFLDTTSGPTVNVPRRSVSAGIGLTKKSDWSVQFMPYLNGELEGDEIVIRIEKPIPSALYRCPAKELLTHPSGFVDHFKEYLLRGLLKVVSQSPSFSQ